MSDPFDEVYKGGRGAAVTLEMEKQWCHWFFIGSVGFTWQRTFETIFYKEYKMNGHVYEFKPVHQFYCISPEIAFGRKFNLSDEISLGLDLEVGFPFLLNRTSKLSSFKIYEAVSDANSYFEMETSYSRKFPIQGSIGLQLNFPLGSNVIGLGCHYSFISPIINTYQLKKVVGLDYETYPEETSGLLNRALTFSVVYKFGLKRN